jgi:HSP20 family molecular chaperone IbpA
MAFLDRLQKKGVHIEAETENAPASQSDSNDVVAQLPIDLIHFDDKVILCAQVAGTEIDKIRVSVEGSANIVILEGERSLLEYQNITKGKTPEDFLVRECQWGKFYRRIILPESIRVDDIEAKIKNGTLIVVLPLVTLDAPQYIPLHADTSVDSKIKDATK